jgi:hypothetical protein
LFAAQVSMGPQLPHETACPHPSLTEPHVFPSSAQVFGVQVPTPQTLAVCAPHVAPPEQFPQSSNTPQPSISWPQFLPAAWHEVGVQLPSAQTLG